LQISLHAIGVPGLLFVVCLAWAVAPRPAGDALVLHVLSVGNGTATLIELPNGRNLMYDVGCWPAYDVEKWAVGPVLARDRCRQVDAVLLSHGDLDHYLGLPALLDRRTVNAVFTTPDFDREAESSVPARRLVADMKHRPGLWRRISRGDRLSGTGAADVEVLWPPVGIRPAENNDASMVVRVTYAGRRILLCGDVQDYALEQLIATTDLQADVLLLPHHGSVVPSTAAFVRAVDPQFCIRSSARPITDTLARVVEGRRFLTTADNGAIEIHVLKGHIIVTQLTPR
jgi:competence protein ComEC